MKQKLVLLCAAAASLSLLVGCGDADVTESTVELKKNGKIVEYTIEDFSESYYDAEELQSYIDSEVESWSADHEGSVKVKKSEVVDQTAYLTMQYDSTADFSDFNRIECFSGSIVQAQAAGYDFNVDFEAVNTDETGEEEGSVFDAEIKPMVSREDVLGNDELKVFIIRDHVDVIVPGTIEYVSAEYTEVLGKNTVSVKVDEEAAEQDVLVYVLYK